MNFPVEISFGVFKVNAHLLFEILAFSIGFRYFLFKRKRSSDPINQENRIWIILGATFGALIFSRLIGSLENPIAWWESKNKLLYLFTNKTITGGLFGGLLGVELTKFFIKEEKSSGDLFTEPLILAMIIGRIGCFCNGVYEQTYGIPTNLPWGMNLGDNLLRHPVALYEIIFLLFLWLIIIVRKRSSYKDGSVFKLFMVFYFLFRLPMEKVLISCFYLFLKQ